MRVNLWDITPNSVLNHFLLLSAVPLAGAVACVVALAAAPDLPVWVKALLVVGNLVCAEAYVSVNIRFVKLCIAAYLVRMGKVEWTETDYWPWAVEFEAYWAKKGV